MTFAKSPLSVVPVRSNSTDKSEQVTQLLFGEVMEILEMKGKSWAKIRCQWDNYIGWVDARQIKAITLTEYKTYQNKFAYCLDLMQPIAGNDRHLPITIGAQLPDFDGLKLSLGEDFYTFSGQAVFPKDIRQSVDMVVKIARKYLYAPFQWGGRSPLGIDASGFTQMVFKILGINLHREPNQQVYQGNPIDFIEEALPGDLAFFENRRGNISHVGIIFPEEKIIHAAGQVRMDKIDHYGIFNQESQKYTHRLRVLRRFLEIQPSEQKSETTISEVNKNQVELF
jgi:cell wall-associated NlpC family hydrolase